MTNGNYFGTEINGQWWRRYRGPAFFARGNGEFSMDEAGIRFLKKLTKLPLSIPWSEVSAATLGKGHAGRWAMGRPVLKISFSREGQDLEAGFFLSPDWAEMEELAADIDRRAKRG